jgi:UDP-N-acetyl-D-glucosamine dehydrogenase
MFPKNEVIGIVGLGYVGLPLALTFVERGTKVVGIDVDARKVEAINAGRSYLAQFGAERIVAARASGRLSASTRFEDLGECSAFILAVPTPLTKEREPDLSYVLAASRATAPHVRPGVLVCLESTTYPGTTREQVIPVLESGSGLRAGDDFAVVFSPEREDPGNARFSTSSTPKVVGGLTPQCLERGLHVYGRAVDTLVPVSSLEAAETTKLLENIFRAVNIALVNEMKLLTHRFTDAGRPLDIHEIIRAASTKPFGFMPFFPGPGLGGHCIPIDPFYLTWKAREYDFHTRFIELAGEINMAMPYYVVDRLMQAMSARGRALGGATVLVVGVAYKADIDDLRESPALKIIKLLEDRGATVRYHDPHVPDLTVEHIPLKSVPLTPECLRAADAVLIATAHSSTDYRLIAEHARLVVDTRDAMRRTAIAPAKLVHA